MIGGLFAGLAESPGRTISTKTYLQSLSRNGSLGAMVKGSRERYRQSSIDQLSKLVPEGVEGRVPFKGPLPTTFINSSEAFGRYGVLRYPTIEELSQGRQVHQNIPSYRCEKIIPMISRSLQESPNYSPEYSAGTTTAKDSTSEEFGPLALAALLVSDQPHLRPQGWSPQPFVLIPRIALLPAPRLRDGVEQP